MQGIIFNPLEEYESTYEQKHAQLTQQYFDRLVESSGVDVEQNRSTVRQYDTHNADLQALKKKLKWLKFWRVIMCITLVLIPVVIWKTNPQINALKDQIQEGDRHAQTLLEQAQQQMASLNGSFTDMDAIRLVESAIPNLSFSPYFTVEQETDMKVNYDFQNRDDPEESTLDVLSGTYNENPFLFENKVLHRMGTKTYTGHKTIYWTETYRDTDGKTKTRTESQTLEASVTKPMPYYHTQVVLNYCAQGAPDLCFSRDASHLDQKSDKAIERMVKRGEKKLNKKTQAALGTDSDFVSMSNTDFEVLFDALNRDDEVQFRTLFTPLAQTNMVDLIRSKTGYGDDFHFIKAKRTNQIVAEHSQGRQIKLCPDQYRSYSFDAIRRNFLDKNKEFFKAVYFDFAPIWAIPVYQDPPVQSLAPIPDPMQLYAQKECEVLANAVDKTQVVHPATKTHAILKTSALGAKNGVKNIRVEAYSYDIAKRVDHISVLGGDGHYHDVPVEWDEYLPLQNHRDFGVALEQNRNQSVLARHDGLCIFHL